MFSEAFPEVEKNIASRAKDKWKTAKKFLLFILSPYFISPRSSLTSVEIPDDSPSITILSFDTGQASF
ncbi:hypothetical protein D3C75_989080 [compost metagenome]